MRGERQRRIGKAGLIPLSKEGQDARAFHRETEAYLFEIWKEEMPYI